MTGRQVHQVTLETPEGLRSFDCGEEEHIWDTAAAYGIALPAICHHGRCLTCAGRLLEGTVEHDHPDAYFAEDEVEGYVLLCHASQGGAHPYPSAVGDAEISRRKQFTSPLRLSLARISECRYITDQLSDLVDAMYASDDTLLPLDMQVVASSCK
jgi:ferredoxin